MEIPETKKINGIVYNKVKEYPNFVLYRNKNGIIECFGYFELQENVHEKMQKQKLFLGFFRKRNQKNYSYY